MRLKQSVRIYWDLPSIDFVRGAFGETLTYELNRKNLKPCTYIL